MAVGWLASLLSRMTVVADFDAVLGRSGAQQMTQESGRVAKACQPQMYDCVAMRVMLCMWPHNAADSFVGPKSAMDVPFQRLSTQHVHHDVTFIELLSIFAAIGHILNAVSQ